MTTERFIRSLLATALLFCLPLSNLAAQQNIDVVEKAAKSPEYSAQARFDWHSQHLEMRDHSPYKQLQWKHIGPVHMSGRVTDIARSPDQPRTFYVTTASGGVFKTTDEGDSWAPIFDDAPSAAWGAVCVAPTDSKTVWIGGGESNVFRSSMAGTGVYRSNDAGKSWTHMGLADTHHIGRIVIHPTNPDIVWVAAGGHEFTTNTQRGIFKTTDGGTTWKKVLYESDMVGGVDLVIDPNNPDVIYASMWHRIRRPWSDPVPGPGGGIYKSTNGGESWKRLSKGLPRREKTGRIGISLCNARPNVVYALLDNHEIARAAKKGELDSYQRQKKDVIKGAEVYRSDDAGETWVKTSQSNKIMEGLFSTYGWVFGQIRVDPTDHQTSYIMGIHLLKSSDGGKTYKRLWDRGLHADHHAFWIDPENPKHLIDGNDGGINISYDGGTTWKNLENLPCVQFYNVALDDKEPYNVFGSVQDNFSWGGPSDHEPGKDDPYSWKRVPGGEASYHAVDPNDQDTLYSENFYGKIIRSNLKTNKTVDIKPRPAAGEPPLRGQWLAPFMLSPHDSRVVYHAMQYVFRSTNRGDGWERISPDLTFNKPDKQGNISFATISSISESPLKFGLLYAGTDDGRLHVTKDGGQQWKEILNGLPNNKWVSRVVASQFDKATVYLTQNGKRDNDFQVYVYRSGDYGENWEDISIGIPGGPVNVIREDPFDSQTIYVGTDMGVYVTTDGAKTWSVLGSKLPIAFVHDIAIHKPSQEMIIATHGRGVWKLKIKDIKRSSVQP